MNQLPEQLKTPLVELLLSIADDKFFLGHRVADWTGLAPILEEDIAFSSIAQDELAHALTLYEYIGRRTDREADAVAYGRPADAYRCADITLADDDLNWDAAIARQFFCDHFDLLRVGRLARSSDAELAGLARRIEAEERIHVEHVDHWVVQLGRAGGEAATRMQASLDRLAASAVMLFEPTEGLAAIEGAGLYPDGAADGTTPDMIQRWRDDLLRVTRNAGLKLAVPTPDPNVIGGRRGRHVPSFGALLEELTEVYRVEPTARW
ncbi:MAG: 1,2-phenylacetyl-CoA epoxidase, subunit C [Phycisphaerae bacterium]|nr:1,2-phenylacetyl-CoA epoxidase, subunit C [Phycisphaerae bacterium]